MKPILYVGAALMAGASIYGFVDYQKTKEKKEFSTMYEGAEKTNEVLPVKEMIATNEPVDEMKTTTKSVVPVKKAMEKENISEESDEFFFADEIEPIEKVESEKTVVKEPELKVNTERKNVNTTKRKKKINHKLFSRAPLEEKYLEKEIKIEDLKLDPIKAEKKKQ